MQDSSGPLDSLDYTTLDAELRRVNAGIGASEAHGVICGVICVPQRQDTNWLSEIVPDESDDALPADDVKHLLLEIARDSSRSLATDEFEFYPLLPADEFPLGSRSQALAQWCTGFLFGLTLAGAGDLDKLPDESREIVTDLANFATIRSGPTSEEEEQAYAEIVEYVRVGTMLINQELNGRGASVQAPHNLH